MQANNDKDVIEVAAHDVEQLNHLKTLGWISYGMHLIVAIAAVVPGAEPSTLLLLLALVLDLIKKSDAEGTWQESHFRWRINTVLWAIVLYLVTSPLYLLLYFPGKIAWFIVSLWFLVRIVRGMMAMNKNQAITA